MNVIIYARYSSDRQTEQSIEGQLKECYEYARRSMRVYIAKLKRLEKRYDVQNRTRELTKEGSRYDDISRT